MAPGAAKADVSYSWPDVRGLAPALGCWEGGRDLNWRRPAASISSVGGCRSFGGPDDVKEKEWAGGIKRVGVFQVPRVLDRWPPKKMNNSPVFTPMPSRTQPTSPQPVWYPR